MGVFRKQVSQRLAALESRDLDGILSRGSALLANLEAGFVERREDIDSLLDCAGNLQSRALELERFAEEVERLEKGQFEGKLNVNDSSSNLEQVRGGLRAAVSGEMRALQDAWTLELRDSDHSTRFEREIENLRGDLLAAMSEEIQALHGTWACEVQADVLKQVNETFAAMRDTDQSFLCKRDLEEMRSGLRSAVSDDIRVFHDAWASEVKQDLRHVTDTVHEVSRRRSEELDKLRQELHASHAGAPSVSTLVEQHRYLLETLTEFQEACTQRLTSLEVTMARVAASPLEETPIHELPNEFSRALDADGSTSSRQISKPLLRSRDSCVPTSKDVLGRSDANGSANATSPSLSSRGSHVGGRSTGRAPGRKTMESLAAVPSLKTRSTGHRSSVKQFRTQESLEEASLMTSRVPCQEERATGNTWEPVLVPRSPESSDTRAVPRGNLIAVRARNASPLVLQPSVPVKKCSPR